MAKIYLEFETLSPQTTKNEDERTNWDEQKKKNQTQPKEKKKDVIANIKFFKKKNIPKLKKFCKKKKEKIRIYLSLSYYTPNYFIVRFFFPYALTF